VRNKRQARGQFVLQCFTVKSRALRLEHGHHLDQLNTVFQQCNLIVKVGGSRLAKDKETLAFYVNRNESLDQWVDRPETVEKKVLWPDALGLAERAGPNALFRGLRSVLGSDYAMSSYPCEK